MLYGFLGEIRLPFLFAVSYGASFAALTAVLVHTLLYEGKRIYQEFQSSLEHVADDIHAKLMTQYSEVPSWWYVGN